MRRVYLDHNATTPLRPEARELYLHELDRLGGNPSSVHAAGRRARALIDEARQRVAAALDVGEEEVLFTSGGTESNNTALAGVLRPLGAGAGLVTSAVEHSSVLRAAAALEREGHPVVHVPVDGLARLDLDRLAAATAAPACRLVAVVAADNEVGVIHPLETLGAALRAIPARERPLLFTDAVQALGRVPLELERWGADLASFSAHKVGGPLGVGLLVRRRGVALAPLLHGGGQEGGARAGTENAPAIAAAALACELAVREREAFCARVGPLTHRLWAGVRAAVPAARLLGPPLAARDRLCNTLALWIPGVDGRVLVARLDLEGLAASAGSACSSGSIEPSHVLMAMGLPAAEARAGLRLSLGRDTTPQDVHSAVDALRRTFGALARPR